MRIALGMLRGLGDPPGPTPNAVVADALQQISIDQTIPASFTPDMLRANLTQLAQSTCTTWPAQCPNGIPTAMIEQGVADFQAKYPNAGTYQPPAVTAGPAPQVYSVAPAIVPQTSAAPQATALTPSQVMPASVLSTPAPSPAPVSTDYLATVKAWIAASTYGIPNLLVLAGVVGVGFYFYSRRRHA